MVALRDLRNNTLIGASDRGIVEQQAAEGSQIHQLILALCLTVEEEVAAEAEVRLCLNTPW